MSRSFSPPRISPTRWLLVTVLALLGAAACMLNLSTGLRARTWMETPAKVVRCELVAGRRGSEHLNLAYVYTFDGRQFTGTRLGFTDGISKRELAAQLTPGREVKCYVNPRDPAEALLRREMAASHWFFPLIFLTAALGLGYGAKCAFSQQRLANAATLYSLETGFVTPEEKRRAA